MLIVALVIILCLLALIIGLAVGLTKRSNKYIIASYLTSLSLQVHLRAQDLPLPNGAKVYSGDLTYYDPALGACGIDSTDNDAVVAVSHFTFDAIQTGSDPNQNPLCGRYIRAKRVNEKTGHSVSIDVKVIDRCKWFELFILMSDEMEGGL